MNDSASLRVAIVVNSLAQGGAERHAIDTAHGLEDRGHRVWLLALAQRDDLAPALRPRIADRTHLLPRRGRLDWSAVIALNRLLNRIDPHLTLAVNAYPIYTLAFACPRRRPAVAVMHSFPGLPGDSRWRQLLLRGALRRLRRVVFLSESQRMAWARAGVQAPRSHCIPNGVDAAALRRAASGARAKRRALGVDGCELLVGVCAGLRAEKRHDLLLDALARLRAAGARVGALLIGDGPLRGEIERRVARLDLQQAVRLVGFVNDVAPWLAACDVVCLPSDLETLPLSLLEAMALGKPVVATAVGAVAEIVSDGVEGRIVPPGDSVALAAAIAAYADARARRSAGQRGRMRVETCFSRERMLDRYAELLQHAVADEVLATR